MYRSILDAKADVMEEEMKKKAYEKPVLARHGLLRKLTKGTW